MRLLLPLGLLGLISIIALIIIYIIKPNYQQKFVSTTYVWKLSLKYKKRKIPTSKLRNFFLILCQVLFLATCTMILTRPSEVLRNQTDRREAVVIIDSSASMRTENDDATRFERAVDEAKKKTQNVFDESGYVTVILAGPTPEILIERNGVENRDAVFGVLQNLVDEDKCSYGVSNVDSAIALCEDILLENPGTEICFYTDNEYSYIPSTVSVKNVSDVNEFNYGILNAYSELEDNYYTFIVDVAAYGKNSEINVILEVYGSNATDSTDPGTDHAYEVRIECPEETTQRIIFRSNTSEIEEKDDENVRVEPIDPLFSYQFVHVTIDEEDSFANDNNFYIYGGQKETLKVQYASANPNSFFNGAFLVLKSVYADRWDISFKEVKREEEPELEGYDLYVFEHTMPSQLPKDGVVLLVNPDSAPVGAGFSIGTEYDYRGLQMPLTAEIEHPIINGLSVDLITVSKYVRIENHDAGYEELLTCDGRPVLMAKNEDKAKIAVLSFSLHYSSLAMLPEFPLLINNILQYYLPATFVGNSFEVNSEISLNARGPVLNVSGNAELTIETFPTKLTLDLPGVYDFTQTTYFDKTVTESVYVRVPVHESNIFSVEDSISDPFVVKSDDTFYRDLLMYFAIATVALLFAEWLLHAKEGI